MAIKILWLGAVGLGSIVLSVAHRQGLFQKHGVEIDLVPVTGTQVPALTADHPFGYIGAPAALMLAAGKTDLRLLASFDTALLSSCLVVRPEIERPEQLRGKRLGARVRGARMWIHTVLALEKLGLHPERDDIDIAEIGDPDDVVRALEVGEIDGAVLARAQCEQLATSGHKILLDLFPLEMYGAPDALIVSGDFLATHPDAAEGIVAGMIEGAAFALSPGHRAAALESIKTGLNITDDAAAESGLKELSDVIARRPYPSVDQLTAMQKIVVTARPAVGDVSVNDVIDDSIVRKLDESGFIDRIYDSYGVT